MMCTRKRGLVTALLVVACAKKDVRGAAALDAAPSSQQSLAAQADAGLAATDAGEASPSRAVWIPKLLSEDDFMHYSKEVGGERFTKFVIDLKSEAIYYVDSELYPMHKDFIFAELLKTPRTKEAEHAFDKNYGKEKPNFLMCYLVHHLGPDAWTVAFWDGDKATAAHVRLAFKRMKETFYLASKVKFRPNSLDQEAVAAELPEIPQLTNDALYKAVGYQPFHKGIAVGKLRIVHPADPQLAAAAFSPAEIVILPEPLTDITPVAGIISQTFSTPLSHVNLRAAAWDIPNVGLRDAAKTYASLDGKVVRFEAGATSATLRLATPKEMDEAESAKKLRQKQLTAQVPKADLATKALASLDALRASDASAYGSKTANLGAIVAAKLQGFSVPAGFGVPIAYYAAHLKASGLDSRIQTMLADSTFRGSLAERKVALEKLRKDIQDAPVDPTFAAEFTTALQKIAPGDVGVFVRSSTNAEDLAGFSGAGLYDTVPNVHGSAAALDAVKRVWASVWNLAAYEERELYKLDHRQVYGAVLVQIGINATAAGVLVTAHPTDPTDTRTFTINAKSGLGIRVVDGKKVPEIILYNTYNKGLRIVSRSDEDTMLVFQADGGVKEVPNPQKNAPVLTTARVAKLARAGEQIRGVFSRERPLDIEWLFKDEDVFIVQARPYMMGAPALGPSP